MNSPSEAPNAPLAPAPWPARIQAQRAAIAVAVAPFLVLLGFTLVVGGLIEPDIGLAVFVTCSAWVVYELHRYQKAMASGENDSTEQHGL